MPNGTVKWFNNQKGFGFVQTNGINEDIFIHYSDIQIEGFRALRPNQAVSFDIEQTKGGLKALNIKPLAHKVAL